VDALKGSEKEKLIMETLGLLILADKVFTCMLDLIW